MVEYVLLIILVISQIFISDLLKKNNRLIDRLIYSFIYLYIVLLVGLRYKVGIDTYNYMDSYKLIPNFRNLNLRIILEHEYQPLFLIILSFIKTFVSNNFYFVQIIHALFINYAIFYFVDKHVNFKYVYLLIYLLTFFMYFNFEILKESTAVAIFLFAYNFYIKRKYFIYFLLIIIAILIHQSAVILLLFPIINKLKFNYKYVIFLMIFIVFLKSSEDYIGLFQLKESMVEKINFYYESRDVLNLNWVVLQLLQMVIIPYVLFISFRKKLHTSHDSIVLFYITLGIGVLFYQIVFFRFSNYIIPFFVLYLVNIIDYISYNKNCKKYIFLIIFYCCLYNYNFLRGGEYVRWFPYESIINEDKNIERENLYNKINRSW